MKISVFIIFLISISLGKVEAGQSERREKYDSMTENQLFAELMSCSIDTLEENFGKLNSLAINYEFALQRKNHYAIVESILMCEKIARSGSSGPDQSLEELLSTGIISLATTRLFSILSRPSTYVTCRIAASTVEAALLLGIGVGLNSVLCVSTHGERRLFVGFSFTATVSSMGVGISLENKVASGEGYDLDDLLYTSEHDGVGHITGMKWDKNFKMVGLMLSDYRTKVPLAIKVLPLPRDYSIFERYFF